MPTSITTGKVRLSYVNAFTPRASDDPNKPPKYSVTLLIPKEDKETLQKIKSAIAEAADKYRQKNGTASLPAKPKTTLYDGDGTRSSGDPFGPECAGCWVMTVSNKVKPLVVDRNREEILDATELYSGCYGRVNLDFFGYNTGSNKGVTAALMAIQKLADGEPLGGMTRATASVFDDGFKDDSGDISDVLGDLDMPF